MAIGNCPRCGAPVDDENELCYQCSLRRIAAAFGAVERDNVSISVDTSQPHKNERCPKCGCCDKETAYWYSELVETCVGCRWIVGD